MQPLRDVAGVLRRAQAPLGLQPGKDSGPLRTLERNQPGDRRPVLGDLDRLAPAHPRDHLTGVMAQFPQGHLVVVPYDSLVIDETGQKITLPGASKDELKKLSEFNYPA